MKFHEVGTVFRDIGKRAARNEITQLLAQLFSKATPEEARLIAYLALGELHPTYEGTVFTIAERFAVKIVAVLLDLSVEKVEAQLARTGDLGDTIAQQHWSVSRKLSLQEVYEALCAIEAVEGTGSQEIRSKLIVDLLRQLDPEDAALVMRIIIGKLRLGFSDLTMLDALSVMLVGDKSARLVLEHAYSVSADIGLIAAVACRDGLKGIETISITVGIPIRPAAAERLPDPAAIIEKIGPCIVQPKLDGFRVQVHLWREAGKMRMRWFSRNLQDMTGMFPELEKVLLSCTHDTLIVEGEAIAYDEATGDYLPFQETVKRKRKYNIEETAAEYPLRLVLFDLLYLESESMLAKPHAERYKRLQQVLRSCAETGEKVITVIDEIRVANAAELERYFTQMVEHGLEGIVAKRDDAAYQPGKRNFTWIKLKRQHIGNLEDTIDAVVLGYYYGRGKRAALGIGACLVGVYDPHEDRFVTVAKIGTGLSDAEWIELRKRSDREAVKEQPKQVVCSPHLVPDVWVAPKIVLEIAADEITRSPLHTAARKESGGYGLALRFPRMVSFREDKSATDATTMQEIEELYEAQR